MKGELHTKIEIPQNSQGMIGRECPSCGKYFKIKPGTGLPADYCICPYCEYKADSSEFLTRDQLAYTKSIAIKKFSNNIFKDTEKVFKSLERKTRNSFIQIKFHSRKTHFPIKYYNEKDLETCIICDSCGCQFSIYGVFASCPDCTRLTTMSIFKNSIKSTTKRIYTITKFGEEDKELLDNLIADIIGSGVAAFNALGKRLRIEFPKTFPPKPKNLFQNLPKLDKVLKNKLDCTIESLIDPVQYKKLLYLFQVRHIWDHNFGEADEEFIEKTGSKHELIGKRVIIELDDVAEFLNIIENLGKLIRENLDNKLS